MATLTSLKHGWAGARPSSSSSRTRPWKDAPAVDKDRRLQRMSSKCFNWTTIVPTSWIMDDYVWICMNIYQYVSSHITHTGEDWQVGVHLKHQGGIAKRAGWRKANQRSLRLSPMLNGHVRMITTSLKVGRCTPMNIYCMPPYEFVCVVTFYDSFMMDPSSWLKAYWSCRIQTFTKSQNAHAALN